MLIHCTCCDVLCDFESKTLYIAVMFYVTLKAKPYTLLFVRGSGHFLQVSPYGCTQGININYCMFILDVVVLG